MSLQKDIDRHVLNKFETWLKDSTDTYQRAGLPYEESMSHIVFCTLASSVALIMSMGNSPETVHKAADMIIKRFGEDKRFDRFRKKTAP